MEYRFCPACRVDHSDAGPVHNNTPQHRFNFLLYEWSHYRKALVKDRNGIEVKIVPKQVNGHLYNYNIEYNKGKHCLKITPDNLLLHNKTVEFLCTIKNIRRKSNDNVILTSAQILHPYKLYSLYDPNNNLDNGKYIELESGADYRVVVKFCCENGVIASYKIPVAFSFKTTGKNVDTFTIHRAIVVSVEEHIAEEEAAGKSPFTSNDWPPDIEIIPPTQNQRQQSNYTIPDEYYMFLKYGLKEFRGIGAGSFLQLAGLRRKLEPGHVTATNYREFWHIVLWLEEMGQTLMLRRYNMENVTLVLTGDVLELEVPGLAEKRPSVIVGDMIDIRVHNDYRAYRGMIKRVNDKTVEIVYVHKELLGYISNNPKMEIDVRFVLSRLPLERMHQGVDQAVMNGLVPSLFPDYSLVHRQVPQTRTIQNADFFDHKIVSNHEQKTAVIKILNGSSLNAPYIVFGPPGTGKTITIVEAILQLKKQTSNRILVCAPANATCDMLTEKLMMYCTRNELIRIMSENVDKQSINQHIREYTNCLPDGAFKKFGPAELRDYRIVVTTLILIGRYTRKYHPDVVFIDEAAQACEPGVDCAIGMMAKGKQIILAGDPRQLGPSISSKVAAKYGLGKSLLERLMDLELYQSHNPNFITMLKLNFRSHSTILRLPNELFYDNQLQPVSVKSENDPLAKVFIFDSIQGLYAPSRKKGKGKKVKHPGQAIEFCSVLSKESRQGRSPSYFNVKEMQMVLKYVQTLVRLEFEDEDDKVTQEQIGIVTPYIRQVYKIRDTLRVHNLENVEVGTTETFQGREKRVIIISTVRAQQDLLLYDKKYNLGFVKNEKRFNVALTRAMSKLIVIGCAQVLGTDMKWLSYIDLCEGFYAFCGAPYARRTQAVMDDITSRFRHI